MSGNRKVKQKTPASIVLPTRGNKPRFRSQNLEHPLNTFGRYSLESVQVAPQETVQQEIEQIALPHLGVLEKRFDREQLDELVPFVGEPVTEFLQRLHAEAAAFGPYLFFSTRQPDPDIVMHEVVHSLQSDDVVRLDGSFDVLDAESLAEQEADQFVGNDEDSVVSEHVPENTLALRRAGLPTTSSPVEPTMEQQFEEVLTSSPEPATAESQEEILRANRETVTEDGVNTELESEATIEDVPEEEPQPTFELPAVPETELSAEEKAARQAALEESQAAIEQAEDPSGVIGAFADALPSVKAATQSSIGGRVGEVVSSDQQDFQADLPEFHAMMGGSPIPDTVSEVRAPEGGPVSLEDSPPAETQLPDLPPTPTPDPYRENEGIVGFFSRLFGGNPAQAVGQSLREVQTTDSTIQTSEEPPVVPLEGETNPDRMKEQNDKGVEETRMRRDQAMQAVMEGRGPEEAQLREMNQLVPVPELPEPQTEGLSGAEGAEQLNQMALPEEVLSQFDQDLGETMKANLTDAQTQMEQAEGDRNVQRDEALTTAESGQDRLTQDADQEQRDEVQTARQMIQGQRQETVDAQAQAVSDLETEAQTQRTTQQTAVQDRVRKDEDEIVECYGNAEEKAQDKVLEGERKAKNARDMAEREAEEQSWWERAKNFVKQAFAALTAAINVIFDAVRDAIKIVLDVARNLAKGLIDAAAKFIKDAIQEFGKGLKVLIDATVGQVFPGLAKDLNAGIDRAVETATAAVDAVAERLKAGVDALVDTLNNALNAILDVFQTAINASLAVMQAVLTGDWGELARKLLEATLRILGIQPEAFYAFVGQALDVISTIINDPLGFLSNLVNAVKLGFQFFADRFLTHLRAGIIGWLTGALGDIQIPEKFNVVGILDLARQVLGLTWDWLRGKAVRLIGEQNVQRLEFLLSYVQTLITGGFPALFERLKQDLGGLVETVLGAIKEFLVEKVIKAGITWLVSLFSPVGALVKLVFTIWNLYTFLRDQLSRIIQVAQTVVQSLSNIVRGVIEGAAKRIEEVLANLLPVAIDLVAKLLGLTGVTARVRQVITGIRERIDMAVNRLLDRVLKAFRGGEAEGSLADDGVEVSGGAEQIGESLTVPVPEGASHTLSIAVAGAEATVVLASEPRPVQQWLAGFERDIASLDDEQKKSQATQHLTDSRTILGQLDPQADEEARENQKEAAGEAQPQGQDPDEARIVKLEKRLRDSLVGLFRALGIEKVGLLAKFAKEVAGAHRDVLPDLEKALRNNETELTGLEWSEIIAKLRKDVPAFQRPLLKGHTFGANRQSIIRESLPRLAVAIEAPVPEDVDSFMQNTVVRQINNSTEAIYEKARKELQSIQFGESSATSMPHLEAAVQEAVKEFHSRGDKPDDDLVAAVSGKIIPFLTAVAKGDASFGGLQLAEWDTRFWGMPANRKWIKERFRGGGGQHEWIPTNYVGRVIDRARASEQAEDSETAALWVNFQHNFRSPTDILMYPPQGIYLRTVPYPRDPTTHERKPGGQLTVVQGHVGAVYAPAGNDNNYRDEVVAQTKGQDPWHNELRQIFENNFSSSTSRIGMKGILDQTHTFIQTDLWMGSSSPNPGFNEYYSGSKGQADGQGLKSFSQLQTVASNAANTIRNDFDRARGAVGL